MTTTREQYISAEVLSPPAAPERTLATAEDTPVEIVDYQSSLFETVREGWRCRRLFFVLSLVVIRQTVFRFKLGPFWLILQTLMAVGGYAFIFGGAVFSVSTPNGMPYFLFVMVGMMGWQLFMRTVLMSARGFLRLRSVLRDLHIPLVLIPLAGSAQALLQFALYFFCYVSTIIYFWVADGKLYAQLAPKYLAISFLGLTLCLAFAWGIGMWVATLTAWAIDFRMAIRYVLTFWMFVTPVLYPIERLHGNMRTLAELNPLSSAVEMVKVGLLGAGSLSMYASLWSIGTIALVFFSGVWFVGRFGHALAGLRQDLDDDEGELL